MKLSRKAMKEALDSVPMEVVLLGAAGASGEIKLSAKDREFARHIALGDSKAGAYRKSRPGTKAKPETASKRGVEALKRGEVVAQVEAFKRAIEAQKYQTPAHLRALVIHQLTEAALNPEFPPATRVQALKALGTVTEVAAFTERREVVRTTNAADAREKLLATLRQAMQANAVDIDANDLLAELTPTRNAADDPPTPPTPQALSNEEGGTTHSIPRILPPNNSETITTVTENTPPYEDGSPPEAE